MRSTALFCTLLALTLVRCSKPAEKNCATISFKNDLTPIFSAHCATSGCHSGSQPQSNLNLDSAQAYRNLTTKGYVSAGNPTYSIVYDRMTSSAHPMPAAGLLPGSETDKVYCWILQGAPNN